MISVKLNNKFVKRDKTWKEKKRDLEQLKKYKLYGKV